MTHHCIGRDGPNTRGIRTRGGDGLTMATGHTCEQYVSIDRVWVLSGGRDAERDGPGCESTPVEATARDASARGVPTRTPAERCR